MFTYAVADQMNEIFFRRGQQILDIDLREGVCGDAVLAAGLRNLECLGYMFRKEDIERLRNSSEASAATCLVRAARAIRTFLANDPDYDGKLQYAPMYPGFPMQVMEASAAELFINAMLHYLTNGQYMPDSTMTEHARSRGNYAPKSLKPLSLGTLDDFKEMFRLLMNAATSISGTDLGDLVIFFSNFDDAESFIPSCPVFKENSAILAKLSVEIRHVPLEAYADKHAEAFRTPTDVLRLATVLSDGDASLAKNPRFKRFTRSERKAMLRLLEGCTCLLENMAQRRETWLRLGEALHPGDYPRFTKVNEAYANLRSGHVPLSFTGQFFKAYDDADFTAAAQLMSQRPGDFARRIDMMLRKADDVTPIVNAFEAVADKVATRVLLQLREHFVHRSAANYQLPSDFQDHETNRRKYLASIKQYMNDIQAEIVKAFQKDSHDFANCLLEMYYLMDEISLKIAEIHDLEKQNDLLSSQAILESTFDKAKIKMDLQKMSGNNSGFNKSLMELACYLTGQAGLKGTDKNGVSLLKIPRVPQRLLSAKLETAYNTLAKYVDCVDSLWDDISSKRKSNQRIVDGFHEQCKQLKSNAKRFNTTNDNLVGFNETDRIRAFFPKGSIAKTYIIPDTLPGVPRHASRRMVQICEDALVKQYAGKERLGKVYVSEELRHYLVPFSQRSASKALRTIVRGSHIPWASGAKVIRGFIWWRNGEQGRTDIDLSAMMLDENWKYVEHISYTNLRSPSLGCCHSGDIVDAPNGAAEYIDIDIEQAKAAGVRYVAFNVYGFTQQPFCDLPECSFGWMERDEAQSGEIFEAVSVRNKIDLSCDSLIALPVIFDLEEGTAIWMDMTLKEQLECINLENNARGVIAVCRGLAGMHKPNLYDLVQMHVRARGELVDDKAEADVVFDIDDGITPFDSEIWMAEYI